MDLPQIARAVIQRNRGTARVLCEETIKLPDLEQQEILVRVISCALNPTDGKASLGPVYILTKRLIGWQHDHLTMMILEMVQSLVVILRASFKGSAQP
jgi:hypothetical protein